MKRMKYILLLLLFLESLPQDLFSHTTVTIENSLGEKVEMGIEDQDRFLDVLDRIQSYFQEDVWIRREEKDALSTTGYSLSHLHWNLAVSHAGLAARVKKDNWRNYETPVSKSEKSDIHYIVTTLARGSLFTIGKERSSLKKAGDRIDHLHPFRFLMTIFMDEELKAGIASIRDRGGWVKSGFLDGITGSLKQEAVHNNLLPFSSDFAEKVNIKEKLILPSLEKGKWEEFVNILIENIPRKIDPNRYNM